MSDHHPDPIDTTAGIMQNTHPPDGMLGLEFGSSAIKLIELASSKAGYRLESMAVIPLPVDAVVEGSLIDEKAVLHAVRQAIETSRTKATEVTILFHGLGDIRRRKIPRMNGPEPDAGIEALIEETFPWETTERVYDYRIGTTDAPEQMELTAISFPRDGVEAMMRICRSAGVEARYLVSESSCLSVAGCSGTFASAGTREAKQPADMFLRLGGNSTHHVIIRDGRMLDYRWGIYAGRLLTEEIRNAHSCSFEEAERIKIDHFSGIDPTALDAFYDQLIPHVRREIATFHYRHPDSFVQSLCLSGGSALLPGIVEVFRRNLEADVFVADPFEHIEIPDDRFDRDEVLRIAPMMATAVGSAFIHDIDLAKVNIDRQ